jgi:Tfp pilus assembly protein PilV
MILNNSGITLVESMIAAFLTVVVIVGLMSMQSLSWQSAGRSDHLGRATGILQTELEDLENDIMRGAVPAAKNNVSVSAGTFNFFVTTTINDSVANRWLVNVRVTWPGNANGITSSMFVSRQMGFNSGDNF